MFNHAVSPRTDPNSPPELELDIDIYKLKLGTEWQLDLLSFLTAGFQFDYVQPDISDTGKVTPLSHLARFSAPPGKPRSGSC